MRKRSPTKIALALELTPEERSAIGARAHARVSALFELAQMQTKTLQVYDELLGTDLAERFADPPALQARRWAWRTALKLVRAMPA